MQDFLAIMGMVYDLFNLPLHIWGFEFSLWQVMMFSLIVGIVFKFVAHLLYED